jgi:hypothetical protein
MSIIIYKKNVFFEIILDTIDKLEKTELSDNS